TVESKRDMVTFPRRASGVAVLLHRTLLSDTCQANARGRYSDDVDARSLASPPGTPAGVSVSVGCTVPLGDVIVPGWPGELLLRADATSVVDSYRGRG
ncbi:MAG: hypothetical protein REI45_02085, partial [Propionicimonas sp.]|nr:hypothetical protein [Propionicimonas sp.]